jgi:hypothetical protein
MVTHPQAGEILEALFTLPTKKVAEVYDFVAFFCRNAMANAQPSRPLGGAALVPPYSFGDSFPGL